VGTRLRKIPHLASDSRKVTVERDDACHEDPATSALPLNVLQCRRKFLGHCRLHGPSATPKTSTSRKPLSEES
jgi:hypothetical protein